MAREVELGHATCARCSRPIVPGSEWHLDHADDGVGYLGPSHARCNVSEANRLRARDARAWRAQAAPSERELGGTPGAYVDERGVLVRPW